MKKKMSLHLYREWEHHPVTKELQRIFKEIYYTDTSNAIKAMDTRKGIEYVALQVAEMKGRNLVLEKFFTKLEHEDELLIKLNMLDDEIDWEK